jgi:hypothetical protein
MRGETQAAQRAARASGATAGLKGGVIASQQANIARQGTQDMALQNALARERSQANLEGALGQRLFGIESSGLAQGQLGAIERGQMSALQLANQPVPQQKEGPLSWLNPATYF